MPADGTVVAQPLKRIAGYLVAGGLGVYALVSAVGITPATIALLVAIVGAAFLWTDRSDIPFVRPVLIAVAAFVLVKVFTGLLAIDPGRGLRGILHFWPWLAFMAVPFVWRTGPRREVLFRLLALSVIGVSIYSVWQYFFGQDLWRGVPMPETLGHYPAYGFFGNYQTWAGFAVCTALFFGGLLTGRARPKWLFALAALLALVAAFTAQIRGVLVGLPVGAIVIMASSRRGRWLGVAGLLLIAGAVLVAPGMRYRFLELWPRTLNPDITISRIFIWKAAWAMGADHPLTGVGPGNFRDTYDSYKGRPDAPTMGHAHNEWVNEWATSGLLGVAAFSWVVAAVGLALWRRRHTLSGGARGALAAWVGLAAASMVQCHFSDEEVLMVAVFVAAVGLLPEPPEADEVQVGTNSDTGRLTAAGARHSL